MMVSHFSLITRIRRQENKVDGIYRSSRYPYLNKIIPLPFYSYTYDIDSFTLPPQCRKATNAIVVSITRHENPSSRRSASSLPLLSRTPLHSRGIGEFTKMNANHQIASQPTLLIPPTIAFCVIPEHNIIPSSFPIPPMEARGTMSLKR